MGRPSRTNNATGTRANPQFSLKNMELTFLISEIAEEQKIKNKAEHIFGEKNVIKHHLKEILEENNNDIIVAYKNVNKVIQDYIKENKILDGNILDKIMYNDKSITFKGKVIKGIYEPGTFYITEEDYNERKENN